MAREAEDDVLPEDDQVEEQETEELEEGSEEEETEELEEGSEEEETEELEEGSEEDPPEPTRQQRQESRNARQARENRELREKLARIEGQVNANNQRDTQSNTADAARLREEKLALMNPGERERFLDREKIANLELESKRTQIILQDNSDKSDFNTYCGKSSTASKYKDRVEATLATMRNGGTNAPRMTVYKFLLGEDAVKQAERPSSKRKVEQQRAAAGKRVQQAKGKPQSARGDAADTGGGESLAQMQARILAREQRGDTN